MVNHILINNLTVVEDEFIFNRTSTIFEIFNTNLL